MRVSSQMLYESTKKAGISVQTSLLDYINKKDKDVLTNSSTNTINTNSSYNLLSKYFDKTEKAAGNLLDSLSIFKSEEENSIWNEAEESKNNKGIMKTTEKMVDSYNEMFKNMKISGGPLNDFYSKELQNTIIEHEDKLKEIGITYSKDGILSIDQELFKQADIDKVKGLFGSESDFSKKLSIIAAKVEDNARVSMESISSQYSANGNEVNSNYHRYEFWS